MKKTILKCFALLAAMLIILSLAAACASGSSGGESTSASESESEERDPTNPLIGKWKAESTDSESGVDIVTTVYYDFKSDGTCTMTTVVKIGDTEPKETYRTVFTYKIDGRQLIAAIDGKEQPAQSFKIRADILTIGEKEYTRV